MKAVSAFLFPLLIIGVVLLLNGREGLKKIEPLSNAEVLLTDAGFEPREIHIYEGGSVTFSTNRDQGFWPASNLHPQHDIYPDFDPKRPLAPTERWSFVFPRKGTFGYHDHLRAYFNGVIYVD